MKQLKKPDAGAARSPRQKVFVATPQTRQVETVEAFTRRTRARINGPQGRKPVQQSKRAVSRSQHSFSPANR